MNQQLIELLLQLVPKNLSWIKYLKHVPDAIEIVKEIRESTNEVIEILNRPGIMTDGQRKALYAKIEAHGDEAHWQPDETIIDPPNPEDDKAA